MVLPPLTPGERPVTALARALANAMRAAGQDGDRQAVQCGIGHDPAVFVELLGDLATGPGGEQRSIVVVVDQAGELVLLPRPEERGCFLELMRAALASAVPVWLLATLRSEFLSASLRDERLHDLIQDSVLVGPLSRSRLREVIVRPARKARLDFPQALVERIVEDTHGGDALPLLAYTLRELYERHSKRHPQGNDEPITGDDYDAIGGVLGGLSRRADLIAGHLEQKGHGDAILRALLRLVTVDLEGQAARRARPLSEFPPAELDVVRAFVGARRIRAVIATVAQRDARWACRTRGVCAVGR